MLNFIQVSIFFLLFLGLGVGLGRVRVSYRVRVRVYGLRLGLRLGLGIDNLKNITKYLIGGAANTLDSPCPQTPVLYESARNK